MRKDLLFLGIDIGGTTAKIGVVDIAGDILYKESIMTGKTTPPINILENIVKSIQNLEKKYNISALGVGLPGIVEGGIVKIAPNLPLWDNFNIENYLREKLLYPIAVDNDANAAALAELYSGEGRNNTHFVYITLGTGVGGAIIINRKIYKGASGAAGEIGHLIIESNNENCDDSLPKFRRGTLEELIGRRQIIKLAEKMLEGDKNSLLNSNNFDVVDISNAADKSDKIALSCLEKVGYYLGVSIASLANLLDITDFIIGGGISAANQVMYNSALMTAKEKAIPIIADKISIKRAYFFNDTGIIGAAFLAADALKL